MSQARRQTIIRPAAIHADPEPLLAARLVALAARPGGLIHVARSETRAARLHAIARGLDPAGVAVLPGWDCLPYDRASPSCAVMGARMALLGRLAHGQPPQLLIVSVDSVLQRLPPATAHKSLRLRRGTPLHAHAVEAGLRRLGYRFGDEADLPGEATIRGEVIDILPPGLARGVRIEHLGETIDQIRLFDPRTQRSLREIDHVVIGPASELVAATDAEASPHPAREHRLPEFYPVLTTVFGLLPDAALSADPGLDELVALRLDEVREAYENRLQLRGGEVPLPPAGLTLSAEEWQAVRDAREQVALREDAAEDGALPRYADATQFAKDAAKRRRGGARLVIAGPRPQALLAALGEDAAPRIGDWHAALRLPPGSVAALETELPGGFVDEDILVVTEADVSPDHRIAPVEPATPGARLTAARRPDAAATLRPGDAVVHMEHGLGALRGVETVQSGGVPADCLCLEYAKGDKLLVRVEELDQLWRYGAEAEGLTFDPLGGSGWPRRRAAVEAAVDETARHLTGLVAEREAARAPKIAPPRSRYERFIARFPHTQTPDQDAATEAVLADLRSGRPMNRLVCGDVGFGKTEVALRAAAAAALAGWQVAVLAPTTVLVRQHLRTFARRFAGLGVAVHGLSRLSSPAEAAATRAALAEGGAGVVIGTHALAGRDVRFGRLGLVIVDEEQRFGTAQKTALRRLGRGVHLLTMTATPIPRTLQSAMIGLQDLSVIATPPLRRRPVRSFAVPFDPVVVRGALEREHRRGGQSFVVAPRIEDLPELRHILTELVPDLRLVEAHGQLPPAEVDEAMVAFADGRGDVLLSTNIVETGLDVPRANTMIVWRPDRFGLSQLHQLRGRVGRGAARGVAYLLTDPDQPPIEATLRRLRTLETEDRLGCGFAIAARDLDLRGAGDLIGDTQAGHVKLIGLELYQSMLSRALARAHGDAEPEPWTPHVSLGLPAYLPCDYIPSAETRLTLHARLAALLRAGGPDAGRDLAAFSEEIEDRFGPAPEPVRLLLVATRLRLACRDHGVTRLEVGPNAAAAVLKGSRPASVHAPLERHGDRFILPRTSRNAEDRLATADALLELLSTTAPPRV